MIGRVRACMCVCAYVCVRACVHVKADEEDTYEHTSDSRNKMYVCKNVCMYACGCVRE